MFATTTRLQCRLSRRRLPLTLSALPPRPCPPSFRNRGQIRIFTAGRSLLKQQDGEQSTVGKSPGIAKTVGSETTAQKTSSSGDVKAKTQRPDLLAEATVSRKEQRKVDWAIMREMAQYLWPKVRYSNPISQASLLTGRFLLG